MDFNTLLKKELPGMVKDCIIKIIQNKKIISFEANIEKMLTNGNNLTGELYEIDINGITDKGKEDVHVFLKYIIKNDDFPFCSVNDMYEKELFMYLELNKIFKELQDDADVPHEDRLNLVEYYNESNSECIILKNLSKEGYKGIPKMEVISLEIAQQSIVQLAKLHGLSIVLEKKRPNYYNTKIKTLKPAIIYNEYCIELMRKQLDHAVSRFSNETKNKIDKFYPILVKKYPEHLCGQNYAFKCLCHGDFKMNNIIFKGEKNHIEDMFLIDFQNIHYGCPVTDLHYFIYSSSDLAFRKKHLNEVKELYYETLTNFLKYFDVDVDTLCSKQDFDQCFTNSREYGLMHTLSWLSLYYLVDETPTFKDDFLKLTIKVDERYFDRMEEIVNEFIDMGVI